MSDMKENKMDNEGGDALHAAQYDAQKSKKELIDVARRCSNEIKGLRRQIEQLQPKADAYEKLSIVLGLLPRPTQAYGEDLAWMLDKRVTELMAIDESAKS